MERSYLFVPGNRPERIKKALDCSSDAVIIDLEDAVAIDEKRAARQSVAAAMEQLGTVTKKLYVRVNDSKSSFWMEDVVFAANLPFAGVMLPKADSVEAICKLENHLSAEQSIIPLIETAKGLESAYEIASSSNKVTRLAFGAIDYCLDLGISITQSQEELLYPRAALAVASRAAEIESPIDTVFVDIDDEEGLVAETKRAKQLGLFAKLCIHPSQVAAINRMFTPTAEERTWAEEIITAFEMAENQGIAAIKVNGKMVDYPIYKQALAIIRKLK